MTVHSLIKSAIFFAVGHATQKAGSQMMDEIRGLIRVSPTVGWGLMLGALAILGMPPFGVFASEFLIVTTAMRDHPWATPFLLIALTLDVYKRQLGARREMFIGFLAEPALLMVLFSASLISKSTSLTTIVETLAHREFAIYPGLAFAAIAFTMVSLAENARVPVDNPATHLELTMVHEALILEYSGRHLALIEWAASLKLFAYSCMGLALFLPWGVAEAHAPQAMLLALPVLVVKLAVGGFLLALLETLSAKMRIFRVPEFLAAAFLLAVIGMLVQILLAH